MHLLPICRRICDLKEKTEDFDGSYIPWATGEDMVETNTENFIQRLASEGVNWFNEYVENDSVFIGRRIEGGGIIYFDYTQGVSALGVRVPSSSGSFHTYHIDLATNCVICDDPDDTTKEDRFLVVAEQDLTDSLETIRPVWNGPNGTLDSMVYTPSSEVSSIGDLSGTQYYIQTATTKGCVADSATNLQGIWYYVSRVNKQEASSHDWYVPCVDELLILKSMMQSNVKYRKTAAGETLPQISVGMRGRYCSTKAPYFVSDTGNTYFVATVTMSPQAPDEDSLVNYITSKSAKELKVRMVKCF